MHRFAVQHQLFPLDPLPMDTGWANTFGTDRNNVAVWKRTVDAAGLLVDERGLERDSGATNNVHTRRIGRRPTEMPTGTVSTRRVWLRTATSNTHCCNSSTTAVVI